MEREVDLDQLLADAEQAEAEAETLLDLFDANQVDRAPRVRTHEERMQAVVEVVESATPPRQVRTPAERRAAVQEVLEERERARRRRIRSEQERRRAAAETVDDQAPPRVTRSSEQRVADHEAALAATRRERRPRSHAERVEDARRAALEELERRRAEVADSEVSAGGA